MMTPFWYGWSSWTVELLGGACLGLALTLPFGAPLGAGLSLVISVTYERWFDRNGWSWVDVGQRTVGIVVGVGLGLLLRLVLFGAHPVP